MNDNSLTNVNVMAEQKKKETHAKTRRREEEKGNGLSSPLPKLYETVVVKDPVRQGFYQEIADILRTARAKAYRASNFLMVEAYWTVGRKIVEEEQFGKKRADYGKRLIEGLSQSLTEEFGKGYNISNLWCMRQFYTSYPILRAVRGEFITNTDSNVCADSQTLRPELSWTHYRLLLRVEKPEARTWYMNEAAEQNWSTRALERQIGTLYYERLLMSRGKRKPVEEEAKQKTSELAAGPEDFISYKYSVLNESSQLFASQYRLILPTEEELRREIERERDLVVREQGARYG